MALTVTVNCNYNVTGMQVSLYTLTFSTCWSVVSLMPAFFGLVTNLCNEERYNVPLMENIIGASI